MKHFLSLNKLQNKYFTDLGIHTQSTACNYTVAGNTHA